MNITEIKTSKFDGFGVLVPDDSYDFEIYDRELYAKLPLSNGWRKYTQPDLPIGQYKTIGIQTEITEEQAKEIVECCLVSDEDLLRYIDYDNDEVCVETALESFNSLMQKLEIKPDTKTLIIQKIK